PKWRRDACDCMASGSACLDARRATALACAKAAVAARRAATRPSPARVPLETGDIPMKRRSLMAAAIAAACAGILVQAPAQAQDKPIRIGVPTAVQLQVGRDTQE